MLYDSLKFHRLLLSVTILTVFTIMYGWYFLFRGRSFDNLVAAWFIFSKMSMFLDLQEKITWL